MPMANITVTLCPKFVRHPHQVQQGPGFHLVHQVIAVNFYRKLANPKFASNLFVQPAFRNFLHHLPFARR